MNVLLVYACVIIVDSIASEERFKKMKDRDDNSRDKDPMATIPVAQEMKDYIQYVEVKEKTISELKKSFTKFLLHTHTHTRV